MYMSFLQIRSTFSLIKELKNNSFLIMKLIRSFKTWRHTFKQNKKSWLKYILKEREKKIQIALQKKFKVVKIVVVKTNPNFCPKYHN